MATNKIPTMLRLPESLYKKIKKLAQIERRSANAEIEIAISEYISNYEAKHGSILTDNGETSE
jgi:hypothetical protein